MLPDLKLTPAYRSRKTDYSIFAYQPGAKARYVQFLPEWNLHLNKAGGAVRGGLLNKVAQASSQSADKRIDAIIESWHAT